MPHSPLVGPRAILAAAVLATVMVAPAVAASVPTLPWVVATEPAPAEARVARARAAWGQGDPRGVVDQLEPLGLALELGAFVPDRELATLLLSESYLALGARGRFLALTERATAHLPSGPVRDWLSTRRALLLGARVPELDALERPTATEELLAAGRVSEGSMHARAGDPWEAMIGRWTGTAAARRARLLQAAEAIERSDWRTARSRYEALRAERHRAEEWLDRVEREGLDEPHWHAWVSALAERGAAVVSDSALRALGSARVQQEIHGGETLTLGEFPAVRVAIQPSPLDPMLPNEAAEVVAARARVEEASAVAARLRREQEQERQERTRLRNYLERGESLLVGERPELEGRRAELEIWARALSNIERELASVRDAWQDRVRVRTEQARRRAELHASWGRAMERFHLGPPRQERPHRVPTGMPTPDSTLDSEQRLIAEIDSHAHAIASSAPGLLARAHDDSWKPSLVDRIAALHHRTLASMAHRERLAAAVDSAHAAGSDSDEARALARALAHAESELRASQLHEQNVRTAVTMKAIERTRRELDGEREALAYGLALTSWSLARSAGDSAAAARQEWLVIAERELEAFLVEHGGSQQRGEIRFRAADVAQDMGRLRFERAMASYLEAQREGRVPPTLPHLVQSRALELYRAILAQDPDFPHRDAVRFNAGMILADHGDPEALAMLAALVAEHPGSRHVQEAQLRMADLHFEAGRFAAGVPLYRAAMAGADTTLQVIASYKAGWALFREDRFDEAADAFHQVLALNHRGVRLDRGVDLAEESGTYLVHALARAGGADAFRRQRERLGRTPDDERRLRSLAQHLRRYRQDAAAITVDRLYLQDYPLHPNALLTLERLVETHERGERPAEARREALAHAERMAPGGEWWAAQPLDSLREAGARFAQRTWSSAARAAHREARQSRDTVQWRRALDHHEVLLRVFPKAPEAGHTALMAAEAAREAGQPGRARLLLERAAGAPVDSVRAEARWQRVALEDALYERTRTMNGAGDPQAAAAVIEAVHTLRRQHPGHPGADDALWRSAQILILHKRHEDAIAALEAWLAARPDDPRAPRAAAQRAEALAALERWFPAEQAFAEAAARARTAGADSLAMRWEASRPIMAHQGVEEMIRRKPGAHDEHARAFADVAERWPAHELAARAQYRAALAWTEAGDPGRAREAHQRLVARFAASEFARDSRLALAQGHEREEAPDRAALVLQDFVLAYPADTLTRDAWLHAADLWAAAGQPARSDSLRRAWVRTFSRDTAGVIEVLERLAARELDRVDSLSPVSRLLAPRTRSDVNAWREAVRRAPRLGSSRLQARIRFLQGEEERTAAERVVLTAPLPRPLALRQRHQESAIVHYRAAVEGADPTTANAAVVQLGRMLVAFADALEGSRPPDDLRGDDRIAYAQVVRERAQPFRDQAVTTWSALLRQRQGAPEDHWIRMARQGLSRELARRFLFRPEVELPVVAAPPLRRRVTSATLGLQEPDPPAMTAGGER